MTKDQAYKALLNPILTLRGVGRITCDRVIERLLDDLYGPKLLPVLMEYHGVSSDKKEMLTRLSELIKQELEDL